MTPHSDLPDARLIVREPHMAGAVVFDIVLRTESRPPEVLSVVTAAWMDRSAMGGRLDDEDIAAARRANDLHVLLRSMSARPSPDWYRRVVLLKRLEAVAAGLIAAGANLLYRSERDRNPVSLQRLRSDAALGDEICGRDEACDGSHIYLVLLNGSGADSADSGVGSLLWHIGFGGSGVVPAKPMIASAEST